MNNVNGDVALQRAMAAELHRVLFGWMSYHACPMCGCPLLSFPDLAQVGLSGCANYVAGESSACDGCGMIISWCADDSSRDGQAKCVRLRLR